MPRIPERLLDAVFYLYSSKAAAENGDQEGGTGFFLSVPAEFDERFNRFAQARNIVSDERAPGLIYAVTNEHVIRDGAVWAKVNTPDGSTVPIKLPKTAWQFHANGDDLAVCPVGLSRDEHKYHAIPAHVLVLPQTLTGTYVSVGHGDDVFYVGRFLPRAGKARNTPTVRFGNISMMPHEPIPREGMHTDGTDLKPQESFLVEARSLSGYSGSPVFVYEPGAQAVAEAPTEETTEVTVDLFPMERMAMLGVGWGHIPTRFDPDHDQVVSPDGKTHVGWISQNSGMMGVVPAWRLVEMLQQEGMVEMRRKQVEELEQLKPTSADVAAMIEDSAKHAAKTRDEFLADLKKATRRN